MMQQPPPPAPIRPEPLETPLQPEGANPIPRCNWTLYESLPTFSLRDGDLADVSSVLLKATINKAYHWLTIDDLTPADGVKAVSGFIKSHQAQISANAPTGVSAAQIRKAAIILGAVRAVSTTFYRLSSVDLIPGERAPSNMRAYRNLDGEINFEPLASVPPALAATLREPLDLTELEQAVLCSIVTCAMGIIPMQGYSLIMNQHHYLSGSDSQSRRVFAVVEKAYWKSPTVAEWFTSDLAFVQDIMWHKACHPVLINIKENAAMDPDIKDKLVAAGSGACASRLPAEETELRAASSYITLLGTVNPMFDICSGGVNFSTLTYLADISRLLPVNNPTPTLPDNLPDPLKGVVVNRMTAIRQLGEVLKRNLDQVAYCFGWYVAMADNTMMMGASGSGSTDTLKTSWSLQKLKGQSYASYNAGFQAYGDYAAVRARQRAEGVFKAPVFVID